MSEVFITVYPFGVIDPAPREILEKAGLKFRLNPFERKMKAEETLEFCREAELVIAGTEDLRPLVVEAKNLKMISRVGIGLDGVPFHECLRKEITVAYTPDAVTPAVVELTIGLMIDALRGVSRCDAEIRRGLWNRFTGKRIAKCKIGLVGFGRVGAGVARILAGFNPDEILVYDIRDVRPMIENLRALHGLKIRLVSMNELQAEADLISLHVPLTQKTRGMVDKEWLRMTKNGVVLINTSRGEVIDEKSLEESLSQGHISIAALDVFSKEPYSGSLTQLTNTVLTAHQGSCSEDCRKAMELGAAEEVLRFLQNIPLQNQVTTENYWE